MGAAGCCELLGRIKGLKTSNRTANNTRFIPNAISDSFYTSHWRSRRGPERSGANKAPPSKTKLGLPHAPFALSPRKIREFKLTRISVPLSDHLPAQN